jgi:hypothetical protein
MSSPRLQKRVRHNSQIKLGTQTEEVAVVKSERSKDDSELDYQFNISFVFANREQALEQRY